MNHFQKAHAQTHSHLLKPTIAETDSEIRTSEVVNSNVARLLDNVERYYYAVKSIEEKYIDKTPRHLIKTVQQALDNPERYKIAPVPHIPRMDFSHFNPKNENSH